MAGIIEQQPCQQLIGFVAHDGAVGPLGEGFLPDCVKQRAIQDWTPTAHGANINFFTTPNNSSTFVKRMVLDQDGGLVVGSPTGGSKGAGTVNASGLYALNGDTYLGRAAAAKLMLGQADAAAPVAQTLRASIATS